MNLHGSCKTSNPAIAAGSRFQLEKENRRGLKFKKPSTAKGSLPLFVLYWLLFPSKNTFLVTPSIHRYHSTCTPYYYSHLSTLSTNETVTVQTMASITTEDANSSSPIQPAGLTTPQKTLVKAWWKKVVATTKADNKLATAVGKTV